MSSTKHVNSLFALVDCNNFYASCERVFDPKLINKPIVVLSNNDGCVIARSNEAKVLGISMGAPYFQYKELFKNNNVTVFSSNYALYGQMSQRVMLTLEEFTSDLEVYSIDEAFLGLSDTPKLAQQAKEIKQKVYRWTGIPVSIGIAPTKTLAKVANRYAKKNLPMEGVFILNERAIQEKILKDFDINDVWGIGGQKTALLHRSGIRTAWDFASMDDHWIKKNLSVVGLRTAWELRGISCLSLEEMAPPKKSIICSRSFGSYVYEEADLAEALSSYAASAAERLRSQGSLASYLEVFLNTNRFKEEGYYSNSAHIMLPVPCDYTPTFIYHAKLALSKIYRSGFAYKKVGIMLGGIVSNKAFQQDLFIGSKEPDPKHRNLMKLMDKMNTKYGKETLKLAAEGVAQSWKMRRSRCTSHFTTSWEGLLQIKI